MMSCVIMQGLVCSFMCKGGLNIKRASEEALKHLVARTRFELVISALRGRRPEPLDERAMHDL